jgi:SAM-dependent methyltransferase
MIVLNEEVIDRHSVRLIEFYVKKGMSKNLAVFYAKMKIDKLTDTKSPLNYYDALDRILMGGESCINAKNFLDLGCGSGEMVIIGRLLGYESFGYDIYEEEVKLAVELARDLDITEEIFYFESPLGQRFDIVTFFSVFEHIPYGQLSSIVEESLELSRYGLFTLHPNRYKFVDDHTRLPFLGLLPRWLVLLILKLFRIQYYLSSNGEWDVYLRSYSQLKRELGEDKVNIQFADNSIVYPPLSMIGIMKYKSEISLKAVIFNIYLFILKVFVKHEPYNYFPYHNFYITRK